MFSIRMVLFLTDVQQEMLVFWSVREQKQLQNDTDACKWLVEEDDDQSEALTEEEAIEEGSLVTATCLNGLRDRC